MPQHHTQGWIDAGVTRVFVGIDEKRGAALAAALRRVGADLSELTAAHRKIAKVIAARARVLVPVKTGRLRRSLRARGTAETASVTYHRRTAYWAHIVARGHPLPQGGSVPPTDFDYLAIETTRPQWEAEYTNAIDDIIAKHGLGGDI